MPHNGRMVKKSAGAWPRLVIRRATSADVSARVASTAHVHTAEAAALQSRQTHFLERQNDRRFDLYATRWAPAPEARA